MAGLLVALIAVLPASVIAAVAFDPADWQWWAIPFSAVWYGAVIQAWVTR